MRILYTNPQRFPGKIDELAAMANNEKPDLILLTETWCSGHITDAFLALPRYEIYVRVDRENTDRGRGGGLLVYAKTGIPILVNDTLGNFSHHCSFKVYNLSVILIYRSPSSGAENTRELEGLVRATGKKHHLNWRFQFSRPGLGVGHSQREN